MSILDSIKGERKLSFKSWRYRLLHWCFNVKDADINRPQDTGLPKCLYTHYCPLFHVTNLICIFLPLIIGWKITKIVALAFWTATVAVWNKIPFVGFENWIKALFSKKEDVEIDVEGTKEDEREELIKFCCKWEHDLEYTFDLFYSSFYHQFSLLNKEEMQAIFEECMPKILAARERAKIKRDKLRQRMIFWSNFSRVFIKAFLNVLYFALTLLTLFAMYWLAGPIWYVFCSMCEGIVWLFSNDGSLEVLWVLCKSAFWTTILVAGMYGLYKLGWLNNFGTGLGSGLRKLSPPFYLLGRFWKWVVGGCAAVSEFVSMFYEENCPPIVLVTPEEEMIQNSVEENLE